MVVDISRKMTITISTTAYCKVILHAAKYNHCSINGVLLAKSNSKSKELVFVDAIPLFHAALNLTPMAEVALTEIDQYASDNGLIIAGYYTAHENIRECSLEQAHDKVAQKIAENFNSAVIAVVENLKLSLEVDSPSLKFAQYCDGKYRPVNNEEVVVEGMGICSKMLDKRAYINLIDFDNHLDDITQDWKNEYLNEIQKS